MRLAPEWLIWSGYCSACHGRTGRPVRILSISPQRAADGQPGQVQFLPGLGRDRARLPSSLVLNGLLVLHA
jgi:hypothetical protein